jgi:hypothetical protein
VRHVAERAGELFGRSYDDICALTTANARSFFGL